jgi:hypothetical protein
LVARRLCAVLLFVLAVAAIVGAVTLFGTGFAGPAPLLLGGAGGLIVAGSSLWRPSADRSGRGRYPT